MSQKKDRKERSEKNVVFQHFFGKSSLEFGRLYPNIDETTTKNSTKERDYGKEKRSASSSRWLNEHFKDPFVQKHINKNYAHVLTLS